MRKATIVVVSVVIMCLGGPGRWWNLGLREARADQIKCDMPKEMTGFKGTLAGKVAQVKPPDMWSTSGWISIGEVKVLGFSQKMPISAEALTAAMKDKYENVGARDKTVKAPDGVKVGDWMIVDCYQLEGHLRATRMALYHPCEEEANGYLFVKKVENNGKTSVVLRKLFDEKTYVLPMERGTDGKMAPKADLLSIVDALAENAAVVVNLDSGAIKSIKVYEAPKRVEFIKKVTQKIEADTTTKPAVPAQTLVGMEVKEDGASVTILVDPKDKSATVMTGRINTFKAGQLLLIHSTTDGKGAWLSDVKVDPNQGAGSVPTTRPAPVQPSLEERVPDGVKVIKDVAYVKGGGASQSLDLYLPEKAAAPLPLIIYIHGGGWADGDKKNGAAISPFVLESGRGYAVASINHRLSREAKWPAPIFDCKAAVRFLRVNAKTYNLDPDRFGVWGYSSGGHLAALLGTTGGVKELEGDLGNPEVSSRVQAVCTWSGVFNFLTAGSPKVKFVNHDAADGPEGSLLGVAPHANEKLSQQASPITYVNKDNPPFLVVHGDIDPVVPKEQSMEFAGALEKAGVSAKLELVKGNGHGYMGAARPAAVKMTEGFFDEKLKGGK